MADEQRDESAIGDENTRKNQRDQDQSREQSRDQSRDQNRQGAGANQNAEQDDVAEDRNLSGSSTWLNLPDHQPSDDDRAENS